MSSRISNSQSLCILPDAIQFDYVEGQELYSEITIVNKVDRIVNFKVKTNKPGLYLVKPMEGQVFNNSQVSISFKRKELSLENFNAYLSNPGQNKEKFMFQFNSEYEDGVGIQQKSSQASYLAVVFQKNIKKPNQQDPLLSSKIKLEKTSSIEINQGFSASKKEINNSQISEREVDIQKLIQEKKHELQSLITTKQSLLASKSKGTSNSFTIQDLIYTAIFFFMLGFIIL